jgi:hypothetical protein
MRRLRWIGGLLVAVPLAIGQPASPTRLTLPPDQPEAFVQSLYQQVIAHAPGGLPSRANMRIFAPYLSKTLRHRIEMTRACERDWLRLNDGAMIKAPFAWGESGIFSGGNEKTSPGKFQIESVQTEKGGYFRVDVKLTYLPVDGPGSWHVAVIVARANGHLSVDDVVYLKGEGVSLEYRLSEVLAEGCNGPRWVGPPK